MLDYKTKVKYFSGYGKDVAESINEFFEEFESSGNNINIISQTQSVEDGWISLLITYKEDIQSRNTKKKTEIDWKSFPISTRIEKQEFTIRKEVLNIPQYGWERINGSVCKFEEESFKITLLDFWKLLGDDGGFLTAKLNDEEKDFCDLYYYHMRTKDDGEVEDPNAMFNK